MPHAIASIITQRRTVGKAGAGVRPLADPMIDTTSPHGKLILAVLAALAEFERSMILARTSEGRKRAQARGIRFGRKPKLCRFPIAEALARRDAGEAIVDIGRSYGVSHSTISRLRAHSKVCAELPLSANIGGVVINLNTKVKVSAPIPRY